MPTFNASTATQSANTASMVATLPPSSAGDIIVIFAYRSRSLSTINVPTGYTALFNTITADSSRDSSLRAFAKIAGASESNPTITSTGNAWWWVEATVIDGDVTGDIDDLTSGTYTEIGPDVDMTLPSATVNSDGSLALSFSGQSDDNMTGTGTASPPTGYTKIRNEEDAAGRIAVAYCYEPSVDTPSVSQVDWVDAMEIVPASTETECGATVVIPPAIALPLDVPLIMAQYQPT